MKSRVSVNAPSIKIVPHIPPRYRYLSVRLVIPDVWRYFTDQLSTINVRG